MGAFDFVLSAVILGGAGYLLYRSIWKKKGHCAGCSGGGCTSRDTVPMPRARASRRSGPAAREALQRLV
ncbi:MAG: hypothetical protein A2V77_21205 [Anaeromyxobacter sp. RBG_16_69_14]|nr:MAG: hypothetical protein A2V77_21205 [Anaeromyxobacter sp. RBG_16_69_14]